MNEAGLPLKRMEIRFRRSYVHAGAFGSGPVRIPDRWHVRFPGAAPNGLSLKAWGNTRDEAIQAMRKQIMGTKKYCTGELLEFYNEILDNWESYLPIER